MNTADTARAVYEAAMEPAWAAQNRALARAKDAYREAVHVATTNYYRATEAPRLAYKMALPDWSQEDNCG